MAIPIVVQYLKKLTYEWQEAEKVVFEADDWLVMHVKLDTGEYIPKSSFEELDAQEQASLMTLGVEAYAEEQMMVFEDNHVKLGDDTYVKKESFEKLSPVIQNILLEEGMDGLSTEGLTPEQIVEKFVPTEE